MMRTKAFILAGILFMWGSAAGISHAVVTTNITSSGLGTSVSPIAGGVVTITGGTRAGTNLFHSFGLFNVGAGDTANFFNDTGLSTTNILSRVTGGNPSNIFGTIQTTGFGNANLFLINPAGIVFGPNATLNVGGSVAFSTADYIRLADNVRFNAVPSPSADALLSSASAAAFGFLGPTVADISIYGLAVQGDSPSVSFVGGNINLVPDPNSGTPSTVAAHGRQVQLTSVAGAGEVAVDTTVPAPGMALGAITLGGATIDTRGDVSFGDGSGSGGAVFIRGGQLVATGAQILTNPASGSAGQGGTVTIVVTDSASFTNNTVIDTSVYAPASGASGNAGDISVTAASVSLQDSFLTAVYFGDGTTAGGGGAVSVTGTSSVSLTRSTIATSTFFSNADGGAVSITAPIVALDDSGITTGVIGDGIDPTAGNGGAVTLTGRTSVSLTRSLIDTETSDTTGNSGQVTITAPSVTIVGNGALNIDTHASNDLSDPLAGNGGDITITATNATLNDAFLSNVADGPGTFSRGGNIHINGSESVLVTGGAVLLTTTTSLAKAGDIQLAGKNVTVTGAGTLLESDTLGQGGSGTIAITGTGSIALGSGALISTSSSNSGPTSTGAAGNIELNGGLVTISGGSLVRGKTNTPGNGGTITVNANQVQLNNGTISAQSTGTGNAGNIRIAAGDSLVMQGHSTITTQTTQSDGGNISIQAGRLVQLTDSQITTSVQGGTGNGGNITIDPQFVILSGSQILANAFGGNGGNILITAGTFLMDPTSTISASSTFGVSGTVNIQTSVTNLSESVTPLSGEFMQPPELLHVRCAARFQGGQFSSFVVAGRDGLPQEPGGFLPSPLIAERGGSLRLARALDVPSLRAARALGETSLAFAPLETGCAS